jgi:hypothetical protein
MPITTANAILSGVSLGAVATTPPIPVDYWTQTGSPALWSINANNAAKTGQAASTGDILHGPLLPAGTYAEFTINEGYNNPYNWGSLGVSDTYGSYARNASGVHSATWGYAAIAYLNGTVSYTTVSGLISGRYRIASKAGGVIVFAQLAPNGSIVNQYTTTLTSGYNATNLHVVLFTDPNGFMGVPITGYAVQSGSGGL